MGNLSNLEYLYLQGNNIEIKPTKLENKLINIKILRYY